MSEKKGFLSELFGGKKSGGCCNMETVGENGTEAKEESPSDYGCSCVCSSETARETECCARGSGDGCCSGENSSICSIKILGSGCKNCHAMLENTKDAVKAMGLDIEVGYVTDMQEITKYGVMSMPALVVDEKVASMGKVLKAAEVEKLLRKNEEGNASGC